MKKEYKVTKTEAEWKAILTPEQYYVLREAGTEYPNSGEYTDSEDVGIYSCAACGHDLFTSENKYHSGCGWPSFWGELSSAAIERRPDFSRGRIRTEIVCSTCGSHFGHVFNDGPPPTGERYCMNSLAMKFRKTE